MLNSFGTKLHNLRKLRQLTADELANASGVSRSYILLIESGKRQEESSRITEMLARSLRVNPDYFKIENASLPMEILPDTWSIAARLLPGMQRAAMPLVNKSWRWGILCSTAPTISAGSICMSRAATAFRPPNCIVTFLASTSAILVPFGARADAVARARSCRRRPASCRPASRRRGIGRSRSRNNCCW